MSVLKADITYFDICFETFLYSQMFKAGDEGERN
jgi:hypothetical protein